VGTCSHVASVIVYFSHAKYLGSITNPAGFLNDLFKKNYVVQDSETEKEEDDLELDELKKKSNKRKTINKKEKIEKKIVKKKVLLSDYSSEISECLDDTVDQLSQMFLTNRIDLNQVKERIPSWVGEIIRNCSKMTLTNYCSIDYHMLAAWISTKLSNKIKDSLAESDLNIKKSYLRY
jgi:hypothetical protein